MYGLLDGLLYGLLHYCMDYWMIGAFCELLDDFCVLLELPHTRDAALTMAGTSSTQGA